MKLLPTIPALLLFAMQAYAGISIEQYGDSTTTGLSFYSGRLQQAKRSSVDIIYLNINKRFGPAASIANKGVSNSCAIQLLHGEGKTPAWRDRVKRTKADIITFGFGLNDHFVCHRSTIQFADDLRSLVDITIAAGKVPILIEPTPSTSPDRKDLAAYVDAMNLVAEQRKIQIIQHYKIWTALPNWKALLSDGVHPTAQGYQVKGLTEYQALMPSILTALRKP
ncbi:SGNH/GDSL hydrolase family protein [Chromobacterium sphagni]|uniref:SGNH hydrolase-type esterase domain-containing protein n=1 Tax=Chromobacterium sphagni TaxID=1903179 RepID=A0ABX3CH33_9NEIS|nr:SGNH/GDSL hydrolase family protein [Chromobacterium sphagni]OHX21637.1 hypothetical protein BI344_03770 [Chromobacterium sphagni]